VQTKLTRLSVSAVISSLNAELRFSDRKRTLTSRESEILKMLLLNKNRILGREVLLNTIWGQNDYFSGRSLDVFITKLRKYLQDDPSVLIINIRGQGYKLVF
jgi:DNA-binding response OmpR family regulator